MDVDELAAGSVTITGVSALDADAGDTVTYSLREASKGLSINSATGVIRYSGEAAGLPDSKVVTVVASDGKLSVEREYTLAYNARPEIKGVTLYVDPDEVEADLDKVGGSVRVPMQSALDADGDTLTYSLSEAPEGFSIDASRGVISYSGAANKLVGATLTVVVSDGKLPATEAEFTVAADQRPEFAGSSTLYVDPDEADGSVVGVRASDADAGDVISYRLLDALPEFSIDAETGVISYSGLPSGFEDKVLTVLASDGKLEAKRDYTFAYDQRPEFAADTPATVYVDPDELSASVPLLLVSAGDSDTGDTVTYSLREAPAGFSIDSSSGAISYSGLPASFPASTTLAVVVSDGKLESEREITIERDQRPAFAGESTLYVDPDEISASVPIAGVSASDADTGDTVTYGLREAPEGFSIEASSGAISYSGSSASFPASTTLTVIASDGKLAVEREYTIKRDQRPAFEGEAVLYVDVDELVAGSVTIAGVGASDADAGDTVTYSLRGAPEGLSINSDTGVIRYSGAAAGLPDSKIVTVVASDGKLEAEREYTIKRDHRPAFEGESTFYVDPDDLDGSAPIAGISARDADTGDTVTYGLRDAPDGFSIDSSSGAISYSGEADSFPDNTTLTVLVSDGKLESERQITIATDQRPEFNPDQFTDIFIDDNASSSSRLARFRAVDQDSGNTITYTVTLADGTETSQFVIDQNGILSLAADAAAVDDGVELRVTASDGRLETSKTVAIHKHNLESSVDEASYGVVVQDLSALLNNEFGWSQEEVSYQIVLGNKWFFTLDQDTGRLTADGLNYETATEHDLVIAASRGDSLVKIPVKVDVQDVYEGFVIRNAGNLVMMVNKDAASDAYVGTVQAESLDDASLTFHLSNPDSNVNVSNSDFKINEQTGEVRTKRAGITPGIYRLPIWVSDGSTTREIHTTTVVGLYDSYNFTDSLSLTVDENAASGTLVGRVYDNPDVETNSALPYQFSILSGNYGGSFKVDSPSGNVYVSGPVDYEATYDGSRQLLVSATNGFDRQFITINIDIQDINEAPVFFSGLSIAVAADFEEGDTLFNVGVYDEEDDDLTYEIIDGNSSGVYSITADGDVVALQNASAAGISDGATTTLSVRASDGVHSVTRSLSVLAEADATPVADPVQHFTVQAYRHAEGQSVGTVQAESAEGVTGELTYGIIAGNDDGAFTIDAETGALSATGLLKEGRDTLLVGVGQGEQYTTIGVIINSVRPADQKPLVYSNQVVLLGSDEQVGSGLYLGQVVALRLGGGALWFELAADDTDELLINRDTGEVYAGGSSLSKSQYVITVRDPLNDQTSTVNFHVTRDRAVVRDVIVDSETGYPQGVFINGFFEFLYDNNGDPINDDIRESLLTAYRNLEEAKEQARAARQDDGSIESAITNAGERVVERIHSLASDHPDTLKQILQQAFGTKVTDDVAGQLIQRSVDYLLPLPAFVAVLGNDALPGNDGAYAGIDGGTAYIREGIANISTVLESVLLEEIGHHLDYYLGGADARGDEGDIFAAAVTSGAVLSATELSNRQAQNDSGQILDGLRSVDVEFGEGVAGWRIKFSNSWQGLRNRFTGSRGEYQNLDNSGGAAEEEEIILWEREASESDDEETLFERGLNDSEAETSFDEGSLENISDADPSSLSGEDSPGSGDGSGSGDGFGGDGLGGPGGSTVGGSAFGGSGAAGEGGTSPYQAKALGATSAAAGGVTLTTILLKTLNRTVNHPPVFDDGTDDATIYLNADWAASASNPRILMNVHATDEDRDDTLTYTVKVSGAISRNFDVDQTTGDLRLINNASAVSDDRELRIEVWDGHDRADKVVRSVFVVVDHPPMFAEDTPATVYVDPDDVPLIRVTASDSDAGDTVTYSLSEDAPAGFSINPSDGAITYSGSLPASTLLTVVASDTRFESEHQITLVADQRPEFAADTPSTVYVDPDDVPLIRVTAGDSDTGDTVTYGLRDAPSGFSIGSSDGAITYSGAADSLPASASLTVVASDSKLESEHQITLVADQRPEFAEGAPSTVYVDPDEVPLIRVTASDSDEGDTVTYSLRDAPTGFSIDSSDGAISYSSESDSFPASTPLTVVASDSKLESERQITLVADQRPEFAGGASLYLDPDEIGEVVSIHGVSASDADAGDTVTYSLSEDAPEGFSINPSDGTITYRGAADGLFDRTLTVVASDGKLAGERQYTIRRDQRPEFAEGTPSTVYVDPDEIDASVSLVRVSASDSDEGDTVTYGLHGASLGFSIGSSDGVITYNNSPASFPASTPLTVAASDGKLESDRQITIVADQRPEFAADIPSTVYVDPDEIRSSVPLTRVSATDSDAGDTVSYSLRAAPNGFNINPSDGGITYSGTLDSFPASTLLTVVASDSKLESERQITLIADQRPEFAEGTPATVYVMDSDRTNASGVSIIRISASDSDAGDTVHYSLHGASSGFNIDPSSGAITYSGALDSLPDSTPLTVVASDSKLDSDLHITIISDQSPMFTIGGGSISVVMPIEENTPFSFDFAQSLPTDAGVVALSITEGDTSMFSLNREGILTANAPFDYETQSSYAVSITATTIHGECTPEDYTTTSYTARLTIDVLDVAESGSQSHSRQHQSPPPPPHFAPRPSNTAAFNQLVTAMAAFDSLGEGVGTHLEARHSSMYGMADIATPAITG